MSELNPQAFLEELFQAAVAASQPSLCLPPHLLPHFPLAPKGDCLVIGAGKASAAMAEAVEAHWPGPIGGLVITQRGYGRPCRNIEIIEAGDPVPDQAGAEAAKRMLELVGGLRPEDLVICLMSGGGSSLLSLPLGGVSLADKRALTRALLKCGAPISEINTVRKHISAVKGGRLAAACRPARILTLAISDVAGNHLSVIASGPSVPDPTTSADARRVIEGYGIDAPASVQRALDGDTGETPKPGDAAFAGDQAVIIADAAGALAAAADRARALGIEPVILGADLEGEARQLAAKIAGNLDAHSGRPLVLLSGGEATVTVTGSGRGGPNAEFLLALALALDGRAGVYAQIHALACDTDGIDGSEDNAGALIAPDSLARARALGIDAEASLADNDAYGFFAALGNLIITGPTYTNVNDFRAILLT